MVETERNMVLASILLSFDDAKDLKLASKEELDKVQEQVINNLKSELKVIRDCVSIDLKTVAGELKRRGVDNHNSNAVLDVLEVMYDFETELAKEFCE